MKRQPLHTRTVSFQTFRREDGLFEVEAQLKDVRGYDTTVPEKGVLPAGEPVHHMTITATVDAHMEVRALESRMLSTPFGYCTQVENSLQAMVGARMATGWRRAISERVQAGESCTHLRELLLNMATAALQTIPTWLAQQRMQAGQDRTPDGQRPHYLGQCHSWRLDSPVVKLHLPRFHQPLSPSTNPGTAPGAKQESS